MRKRKFSYTKISYKRNVELGIDSECYECTSHKTDECGYPIAFRGGKTVRIHRHLYCESTGENPEVVMHLCDNRKCINLNHLRGGTVADNNSDRDLKCRGRIGSERGENHPHSKLTWSKVDEIRSRIKDGISQRKIAAEFGISKTQVSNISSEKNWKKKEG